MMSFSHGEHVFSQGETYNLEETDENTEMVNRFVKVGYMKNLETEPKKVKEKLAETPEKKEESRPHKGKERKRSGK